MHINEVICIPGTFLLCSASSCRYFPKPYKNKFYSNLVAQCLAFAVNFFVRIIHYLYFYCIRDFKVIELHICFYRKKLKTEFLSLCTAGLFDSSFFSLFQTSSPAHCVSTLSPLVVSNVAGQVAEIRLKSTSFNFLTEQSTLFNISMFNASYFSHKS